MRVNGYFGLTALNLRFITGGMKITPLMRAAAVLGSQKALADAIGVKYQQVWNWKSAGRVPVEHVLNIERATKGFVTRYELRPDIYPKECEGEQT
jgi:DNA-binding transcriptional regulator YdaS (Cro superfamily)